MPMFIPSKNGAFTDEKKDIAQSKMQNKLEI